MTNEVILSNVKWTILLVFQLKLSNVLKKNDGEQEKRYKSRGPD